MMDFVVFTPQTLTYAAVFVGVVIALTGLARMIGGEDAAARVRSRRLQQIRAAGSPDEVIRLLRNSGRRGLIERIPLFGRLPETMKQAGMTMSPWTLVAAYLALVLLVFIFLSAFLGPALGFAAAVVPITAALGIGLNHARARRINKLVEQLPDALELMARGLRVGHPIGATVSDAARKMPEPIAGEFRTLADQIAYGDELTDAFGDLGARVDQEDFRFLAAAVSIQAGSGGNLGRILRTLSKVIRGRFTLNKKIRAISSEGRLSMQILSVLPFVLIGVVMLTSPSFYGDVSDDPLFPWIGGLMVTLITANYLILRRLVNFRV